MPKIFQKWRMFRVSDYK